MISVKKSEFVIGDYNESQLAYIMLYQDEGCIGYPYDDATGKTVPAPVGKLSIGIGHNLDAAHLCNAAIKAQFEHDLRTAQAIARRVLGPMPYDRLSQFRRLAVINLAFSLGEAGLSKFKDTLAAIRAEDWEKAGSQLKQSLWWRQVDPKQVKGLGRDDRVFKLLVHDSFDGYLK